MSIWCCCFVLSVAIAVAAFTFWGSYLDFILGVLKVAILKTRKRCEFLCDFCSEICDIAFEMQRFFFAIAILLRTLIFDIASAAWVKSQICSSAENRGFCKGVVENHLCESIFYHQFQGGMVKTSTNHKEQPWNAVVDLIHALSSLFGECNLFEDKNPQKSPRIWKDKSIHQSCSQLRESSASTGQTRGLV